MPWFFNILKEPTWFDKEYEAIRVGGLNNGCSLNAVYPLGRKIQ